MTAILDSLESQILNQRVWVPAEIKHGVLRFAEQVTVENKGCPKHKTILLSRKKPSSFEEQDVGTFKLNEDTRTRQLDREWAKGVAQDISISDGDAPVYTRKWGCWVPRYKTDSDMRHFLKSVRRAQDVIAAKQLGASFRSEQPAILETGQHGIGGSPQ